MDTTELGKDILKNVSRSFYLTLRFLPSGFREPMSLGYLLARLSDTIADAGKVDPSKRQALLEEFRVMLSAPAKHNDARKFAQTLPGELGEAGLARGEWDLVLRAADCFGWLHGMDRRLSKHVRKVVGTITEGQHWDLVRFRGEDVIRLEDDKELEEYTDKVAGCVGRFWTEVGFSCDPEFAKEDRETMLQWGTRYGKGLQLVNILRDLPEDLERGRCYLPGNDPPQPGDLTRDARAWQQRAREFLADGFRYTGALRGVRLRFATGLPALLGMRTLNRLEQAGWAELADGVKVSRAQVKHALVGAFARSTWLLPGSWAREARRACQSLST